MVRNRNEMAKRIPILVAEDEETDVFLLERAFQKSGAPITLIVVHDGQEAIEYLEKVQVQPFARGEEGQNPVPALLLLDLKMPRLTGFDVLAWIKERPALKHMPIVVLTSSSDPEDMKLAAELGAVDYKVKTGDSARLLQLVVDLQTAWIQPILKN
jgi:CheY-like chemotaxis protein